MSIRPIPVALATLLGLLSTDALAGGKEVSVASGDLQLKADEYGAGERGVVLVHEKNRSAEDWTYFAEKLASNGFHVLAVDVRGHGRSKLDHELGETDYPPMIDDVRAAGAWLTAHGATSVAYMGAELGANLALNAATRDDATSTVIMLSPRLSMDSIKVGDASASLEDPLWVVYSAEDRMGGKTAQFIGTKATSDYHAERLEDAGIGTRMLNREAKLEGLITSWLNGAFKLAGDEANLGAREVNASANLDEVETTGEKLYDDR